MASVMIASKLGIPLPVEAQLRENHARHLTFHVLPFPR